MPSETPATGDPADPPVHHVAFPMGTEGPYTLAELRGLLQAGRLRPDDRVIRDGSHAAATVVELIPEASELAATAANVRRRSTSGAHRAQRASTASEARRFRTPLPTVAAADAPAAAAPPSADVPAAAPRRRRLIGMVAVLGLLLGGLAAAWYVLGLPMPREAVQQPVGRWRFASIGSAGGPWILDLDETSLTITAPGGGQQRAEVVRTVLDGRHVELQLKPPHPILGGRLSLVGIDAVDVTTAAGTGRSDPQP